MCNYVTTIVIKEYKCLTRTKNEGVDPQPVERRTLAAEHGSRDVGTIP